LSKGGAINLTLLGVSSNGISGLLDNFGFGAASGGASPEATTMFMIGCSLILFTAVGVRKPKRGSLSDTKTNQNITSSTKASLKRSR